MEATKCRETQKAEEEQRELHRLKLADELQLAETEKAEVEEEQHKRHVQESENDTRQNTERRVQEAAEEATVIFEQTNASRM